MALEAAVVKEVISRLVSFGSREIGLLRGVKKEMNKLRDSLTMIQAVLQDAERKQVGSDVVRLWLKKLKDVAYEAEDLLDEIQYEDLQHENENKIQNEVHNFFTPNNPLLLSDKIAREIEDIYQKLDHIAKEKVMFRLSEEPINMDWENVLGKCVGSCN